MMVLRIRICPKLLLYFIHKFVSGLSIFYSRKVYTSLSFIIPVIVFTLAYNIPKFFELTTTTKMVSEENLGNNFETCVNKIFHSGNNSTPYFFRDSSNVRGLSNQLISDYFASNKSLTKEEIFLVADQSLECILETCCNCTNNKFLNSSDSAMCSTYKITGIILNLIEFLSNSEGRSDLQSFTAVFIVRWNMQMISFIPNDNVRIIQKIYHFIHDRKRI